MVFELVYNDIRIYVEKVRGRYFYYALNFDRNISISLMFDTEKEAIQQAMYNFGQWIDFVV